MLGSSLILTVATVKMSYVHLHIHFSSDPSISCEIKLRKFILLQTDEGRQQKGTSLP